jgi:hypothetical protein
MNIYTTERRSGRRVLHHEKYHHLNRYCIIFTGVKEELAGHVARTAEKINASNFALVAGIAQSVH